VRTRNFQQHSPAEFDYGLCDFSVSESSWTEVQRLTGLCPLWVMCGRRLGKNFLTLLQHWSGAVMCAACLAARIGSQSKTRTLKCADPSGFSRSPDRPCLHYVVVSSPIPSKPQTPSRCLASPPSISLASTQPPYSTSMPQRGRRPQHQEADMCTARANSGLWWRS
jgi:hypothetical protein